MQEYMKRQGEHGPSAVRLRSQEQDVPALDAWADDGGRPVSGPGEGRAWAATTAPDAPDGAAYHRSAQPRARDRQTLGPVLRTLLPTEHQFEALVLPWSWCRCCQRAFVKGTFRRVRIAGSARHPRPRFVQQCPYQDCWGQILRDSRPWASIRQNHPDYPEQPERHVIYPQ